MSIEIDDPKTAFEKVDAAANFVEQMFLGPLRQMEDQERHPE